MSLREQKKAEALQKTLDVAHELFHTQGFDETTIEEICAESKISKRTFFRYFRDKESLLFPNRDERLEAFKKFLDTYDHADSPFDVLRLATEVFSENYSENADKIVAQQRIIQSSPALRAREAEIDSDWEREVNCFSGRENLRNEILDLTKSSPRSRASVCGSTPRACFRRARTSPTPQAR